MKVYDIILTNF